MKEIKSQKKDLVEQSKQYCQMLKEFSRSSHAFYEHLASDDYEKRREKVFEEKTALRQSLSEARQRAAAAAAAKARLQTQATQLQALKVKFDASNDRMAKLLMKNRALKEEKNQYFI